MNRQYKDKDLKLLWGIAAVCAFPGCRKPLVRNATQADPAAVIGEIAHIVSHKDGGPRADVSLSKRERDSHDNLILLCPTHHTEVDKQPNTYTADELRKWKKESERWVVDTLVQASPRITFLELEEVAHALISARSTPPSLDLIIISPEEKMRRNALSEHSGTLLTTGLSQARTVQMFIQKFALTDPNFPERLILGFREQYNRLRAEGFEGDDLFEMLSMIASAGSSRPVRVIAGVAILAHLFETCEIFEK